MAKKSLISIIIVHYKVLDELCMCIESIYKLSSALSFEIIVIDNDERSYIEKILLQKFPKVVYIKNHTNTGYSAGNNLGAKHAKGDFLFFLNPDTFFENDVLNTLSAYLEKHIHVAIVAPLLLNSQKKIYPLQGAKELTPVRAIFSLSFVQKLFPKNKIANEYWIKEWDKKSPHEVDVIPGTAFMIRKSLFEQLQGFDEKYFLFFEEHDFCNRVRELGLKIMMIPSAQVIHLWGESTKRSNVNIQKIFIKSRFYYFRKFYGLPKAMVTETILRISKETFFVGVILLIATFLRFYELSLYMPFIGDFGWFYISARDMLLTSQIPLVGIASSHPWLHQGAFWTYILSLALWIGNFNPIFGGYAAALIGIITVFFLYLFSKELFGTKIALFSTLFYATSPLVVSFSRMPYHTAPIPLFVLLYIYALYKWIKGSRMYFCLSVFWLVILYNFELATSILALPLILLILYGIWKKEKYMSILFYKDIIFITVFAIIFPLLPMLLYDTQHTYVQTFGFASWIGYRILVLFGYPKLHPEIPTDSYTSLISFFEQAIQRYFYLPNSVFACLISLGSFSSFIYLFLKKRTEALLILFLTLFIPLLTIFLGKVPSEAYLPMIFIQLAFSVGIMVNLFFENKGFLGKSILFLYFLVIASNAFSLISQNFFTTSGYSFIDKKIAAEKIISLSQSNTYTIVGKGVGSKFESFTMPYAYLTWWYGKPESKRGKIKIFLEERPKGIFIQKEYN